MTTQRKICKRCENGIPHVFVHGTVSGYRYHRCSCRPCKNAMNDYVKKYKDSVQEKIRTGKKRMPRGSHGTVRGYSYYGCRKKCCRDAEAAYQRDYYARKRNGFKAL